jgi:hypothetical protein
MTNTYKLFAIAGLGVLIYTAAGILSANPSRVNNVQVSTMLIFTNTLFLLALLAKVYTNK